MSNFPFTWWNETITIYNRVVDPTTQRITWYRNTIENCFWKCSNLIYNMGRYGMSTVGVRLQNKEIICRIPEDSRYVGKREWLQLSDKEKADHFTLENGDILVLGEVKDTIDEYTSGQRSTDLLTKYKEFDECLEIETYVINVRPGVGMPHYKITGT